MELGRIDLDDGRKIVSERRERNVGAGSQTTDYMHDLPRLFLLIIMLAGAVVGGMINHRANSPERIIGKSLDIAHSSSFEASMEGTKGLETIALSAYRNRQQYSPDTGITTVAIGTRTAPDAVPFDAITALDALRYAADVVEYDREDMYGHGSRRFEGSIELPGSPPTTTHTFQYWIDFRSLQPVRLVMKRYEKNVGLSGDGESVPLLTYLNFRYLNVIGGD